MVTLTLTSANEPSDRYYAINSLKGKNVTNTVTTVHRTIGAAKGFTGT
ncbi:hypothetical protein BH18THE2_BH18THE2_09290 [soil metagenome]